jgi:phosphotriesterase-related protein
MLLLVTQEAFLFGGVARSRDFDPWPRDVTTLAATHPSTAWPEPLTVTRVSVWLRPIDRSIDKVGIVAAVNTATGTVEGGTLGATLMHEHLYANLMPEYRATGLLNDAEVMQEELAAYTAAGGSTVVDVTPAELTVGAAPDPRGVLGTPRGDERWASRTPANVYGLRDLAEASGVTVVIGTGHYRDPYLGDGWLDQHSVDEIAEQLVADVTEGISGTGIKAGIIGEIGADKWYISAREERSFRAAARAQKRTGLALTTHAARWPVGIAQLDLLAEEGVDAARVVIGHCDSVPLTEYHERIAQRGAFVQYDLIRGESARQTQRAVDLIVHMIRAGHLEHLLLSHDVCTASQLACNGGSGFGFVPGRFSDSLREAGVSDEEIDILLVQNPRRALAGE